MSAVKRFLGVLAAGLMLSTSATVFSADTSALGSASETDRDNQTNGQLNSSQADETQVQLLPDANAKHANSNEQAECQGECPTAAGNEDSGPQEPLLSGVDYAQPSPPVRGKSTATGQKNTEQSTYYTPQQSTLDSESAGQSSGMTHTLASSRLDGDLRLAANAQEMVSPPMTFEPSGDVMSYGYGCGSECGDSCGCRPCPVWIAGVESTFLFPDLNAGGAIYEGEDFANPKFDTFNSFTTDVDSMYLTPRLWLGVQGCCWGVTTRYWHLRAHEGDLDGLHSTLGWEGAIDTGAFMFSQLEAYTIDLEITRRFCLGNADMQFAVGARHASVEHFEGVTGISDATEALLNGYGRAHRISRGTGVYLGLYGRKPLFCNSCVHWYYNFRVSALWGQSETDVETFASVIGDDASAYSVNGARTSINDDMFIGEIQVGLEWDYPLACLPAEAFFRIGAEYQGWDGGDGYSTSTSFAEIEVDGDDSAEVNTYATAPGIDLDLFGVVVGAGLTW